MNNLIFYKYTFLININDIKLHLFDNIKNNSHKAKILI